MLLNRIHLKNFKRFRDEEVTFRDGITGVIGSNGAGKSTIIEAVLFALYGVKTSGLEGEFVISSFAPPKERCLVSLDFSVSGREYTVSRTFRRTPSTLQHEAQLVADGALLADGVSSVEKQIIQIAGMGASDFRNTIFAGQKDLLAILDKTPGETKKWLMRMLGIDFLKNESDRELKNQIGSLVKKRDIAAAMLGELDLDAIETELSRLKDDAEKEGRVLDAVNERESVLLGEKKHLEEGMQRLQEKKERANGIEILLAEVGQQARDLKDELRELKEERAGLESLMDEFRRLESAEARYLQMKSLCEEKRRNRQRYEALNSEKEQAIRRLEETELSLARTGRELEALRVDREKISALEPKVRRRNEVAAELEGMREIEPMFQLLSSDLSWIRKEYGRLEADARDVRSEIEEIEKMCGSEGTAAALEEKLGEVQDKRDAILSGISSAKTSHKSTLEEIKQIEEQMGEIRHAGKEGRCPTCRRPLGETYPTLMEDLDAKLGGLGGMRDQLSSRITVCGKKRENLEAKLSDLERKLEVRKRQEERLNTLTEKRRDLYTAVEKCISKESDLSAQISELHYDPVQKSSLEKEFGELEDTWKKYLEADERLKSSGRIEAERTDLQGKLDAIRARLSDLEQSLSGISYDPDGYADLKEAYDTASDDYHRFIEMKGRIEGISRIENNIEAKERIAGDLAARMAFLSSEAEAVGYSEEEEESTRNSLAVCVEKLEGVRREISARSASLLAMKKDIARLESEKDKSKDYQQQCSRLQDEIALLETTRRLLGDYILYLLHVVRSQIEGEAARVLSEITDGRYGTVHVDEDFSILIGDMGESYPAKRFSGGEQDDIAIAIRIALSRYLNRLHGRSDPTFLIFDEIFGSQDEERRGNLIKALRTQEAHFPQIFLISHIPEIQGEFSNTLLVEMEMDESSSVTEASL